MVKRDLQKIIKLQKEDKNYEEIREQTHFCRCEV